AVWTSSAWEPTGTGPPASATCSARPTGTIRLFLQADAGIRDFRVTGVQTCALPICWGICLTWHRSSGRANRPRRKRTFTSLGCRSEERRVGKERNAPRVEHHRMRAGDHGPVGVAHKTGEGTQGGPCVAVRHHHDGSV